MDWNSIITSILGAGAVSGGAFYVAKRMFDRTLDLKISKLSEQNKAYITESIRRQAEVFNKQMDALELAVSLAYRLRNTIREIQFWFDQESKDIPDELLDRADNYHRAFVDLLYEKRALLSDDDFLLMHEIKQHYAGIKSGIKYIKMSDSGDVEVPRKIQFINEEYQNVDMLYLSLVRNVKNSLGIDVAD